MRALVYSLSGDVSPELGVGKARGEVSKHHHRRKERHDPLVAEPESGDRHLRSPITRARRERLTRAGGGQVGARGRWYVAVLLVALVAAACGTQAPSVAPSPSPTPRPTVAPSSPGPVSPSPAADPFLGQTVVTVSDRLRVRSKPEVSDDSVKYEPLLPLGTDLRVVGGPVGGSGYVWYEVEPITFPLRDGVTRGWVAMAGKDGEPWIGLAAPPIAGLEVARANTARAPADAAAARATASDTAAFGLELYRRLLADQEPGGTNLVFSPASIAFALGIARAGARGATAAEMDAVLHTSGWDELGPGLNALDQALSSRNGGYLDVEGNPHELVLRIANSAFAQRGWSIEQAYLEAIAAVFGAGLQLVDYVADPEAARKAINAWVSQKTVGRIRELLEPPDVTRITRLYLVNAIYLKANWAIEFPTSETEPRPFTRLDGSKVQVPTMALLGDQEVPYVRGGGWQATELRYRGRDHSRPLAMMLIRPDDLAAFEAALTAQQVADIASALTTERKRLTDDIEYGGPEDEFGCGVYPYELQLFMPRFGVETRAKLSKALIDLGMPAAFHPSLADFTGIHDPADDDGPIYIADVIHQANIDVDEKGTEAAAVTAVGIAEGGCTGPLPAEQLTFRLDRPFLFLLRDLETGAVLFMGRVVDPSVRS